jgi:hypothetical protein
MGTLTTLRTHKALALLALVSAFALGSCDNVGPRGTPSEVRQGRTVAVGGTVVFRDKDGGFFGILSDNGGQFEPVNLDPQYRTDGLHVKLTGKLDDSHLGKHSWGNPLDVERVQIVRD